MRLSLGMEISRAVGRRLAAAIKMSQRVSDSFDGDGALDTTGERSPDAVPWTIINPAGDETVVKENGKLKVIKPRKAGMSPWFASQPILATEGEWKTKVNHTQNISWSAAGVIIHNVATGKALFLCLGSDLGVKLQVRRMPNLSTWANNPVNIGTPDFIGWLAIERAGGYLRFLFSEDDVTWDTLWKVLETSEFAATPDKIGLGVAGPNDVGAPDFEAIFDEWTFNDRSLPYVASLHNPGAEQGTAGWEEVSGPTMGTRGIPHSGANCFMINTTGAFEKRLPWRTVRLDEMIDEGGRTAVLEAWGMCWTGSNSSFHFLLEARDLEGNLLGQSDTTGNWGPQASHTLKSTAPWAIPVGTRYLNPVWKGQCNANQDCWPDDLRLTIS